MKTAHICVVVRTYDNKGNYTEKRLDKVSCKNIPTDIMKDLLAGEVICLSLAPNVEAF